MDSYVKYTLDLKLSCMKSIYLFVRRIVAKLKPMNSQLLYVLLILSMGVYGQSVQMVDWQMSECEGDPYDKPYKNAVDEISSDGKHSYFTFKFIENCALKPKPSITVVGKAIYIKLENKIPDLELTFCDCCYSLRFTLAGKIDKSFQFFYEDMPVFNLSTSEEHLKGFEYKPGVIINRYNKYWQKEGKWIEDSVEYIYKNGLLVNYERKYRNGDRYYQNLLESYYVIKADTFDRVDRYGRKQGLHINAHNFVNWDSSNIHGLDSIAYYKDGRKVIGYVPYRRNRNEYCLEAFEKLEFESYVSVMAYERNTDENYVYNEKAKMFKRTNMKKSFVSISKPIIHKGDVLEIADNSFYDYDFHRLSIITPNGTKINLLNFNNDDLLISKVALLGIVDSRIEKKVKIYTGKSNYKLTYLDNPNTMKVDNYEKLVEIFIEKGTYLLRYTEDECHYEEHEIYYDPEK